MKPRISPTRIATLRTIPLFRGCSDKELARVDSLVDDIEVETGEILIREGVLGRESFIILSGEAQVTVASTEIAKLGPGDFFGEMAILGHSPLRVATVTATTQMQLIVIEPGTLSMLLEIGSVATVMLQGLVDRLSPAGERR